MIERTLPLQVSPVSLRTRPGYAHVVPLVLGGVMLGLAALLAGSDLAYHLRSTIGEAEIVGSVKQRAMTTYRRTSTYLLPVLEVSRRDGAAVRVVGHDECPQDGCAIGTRVMLRHDAEGAEPRVGELSADFWGLLAVPASCGAVLLAAGLLLWRWRRGADATLPTAPGTRWRVRVAFAGVRQVDTADGPRWVVLARALRAMPPIVFETAPLSFDPSPQVAMARDVVVDMDKAAMDAAQGKAQGGGLAVIDIGYLLPPAMPAVPEARTGGRTP